MGAIYQDDGEEIVLMGIVDDPIVFRSESHFMTSMSDISVIAEIGRCFYEINIQKREIT